MSQKLLLIEDDENFGGTLNAYLQAKGHKIDWLKTAEAVDFSNLDLYALAIVDVTLPGKNGFDLARDIRSKKPTLSFIFLTAKNQKGNLLEGYGTGARDYLTKPVDPEILLIKINLLLAQKKEAPKMKKHQIGAYKFDPVLRKLHYKNSGERNLSPTETQLLSILCEDDFVPREKVLMQIWNKSDFFASRSLDVYVSKLRKYLGSDPSIELINIKGSGFLLKY